jgi:hypothetical protein
MADVSIDVQMTPNPNALKFTLDRATTGGSPRTYRSVAEAEDSPAAKGLLGIKGIVSVFMTANFISVNKTPEADWDDIVPAAVEAIRAGFPEA